MLLANFVVNPAPSVTLILTDVPSVSIVAVVTSPNPSFIIESVVLV